MRWLIISAVLLAVAGAGYWAWQGNQAEVVSLDSYAEDIEPLLAAYCYDCHGDGMDKGSVELTDYAHLEELFGDRRLWEGVYDNLEGNLMPPGDEAQPTDEERMRIVAWIEREIFQLDPQNPDPGRVTLRRLNREEYNNTMRDLFGVDLRPADRFPEDDTGYGFDNVGDVLSLSPALLERYLDASREVLDAVIVTEASEFEVIEIDSSQFRGIKGVRGGIGHLSTNGTVGARFKVPEDGDYEITVDAGGSQAHQEWPIMRVKIEKGPQKDFRVDTPYERSKDFTQRVSLSKGDERTIEMTFLNDAYHPESKDPRQRDRNLKIFRVRIDGPLDRPPPPPSEAQLRWFPEADASLQDSERARKILERFANRAWRRPVSEAEVNRLLEFYDGTRADGDSFDAGVKLGMQAVLVSPNFLFRGEVQPDPDNPEAIHDIDEFALASRLSYFLWSSMPDERLHDLASSGQLRANLDAEIDRMLADPRAAEALTRNFAGQWLQIRNLRLVAPDQETFPDWNDDLRDAMRAETEHFFSAIVTEDRSILEFLDSDYAWLNDRMASFYGIGGVEGAEFRRVALGPEQRRQRGGVITQGSILTITSNPTRTSAVNRGNYVLETILGTPPPPPPEGVDIPALEDSGKGANQAKTLREQLEVHREKAMCASCHARMDPIGFGLENFDGIGAWRETENGKPVDASGRLYTGETFESPEALRAIFVGAKTETFVRNLTEKLLTYALGRGTEYFDKPAIQEISAKTAEGEYRMHALIRAVIHSVPFQKRRGDWASLEIGNEEGAARAEEVAEGEKVREREPLGAWAD